jgi:hypothetical protein
MGLNMANSSLFLSAIREQSHCPPGAHSSAADEVAAGQTAELASDSVQIVAMVFGLGAAWVRVTIPMRLTRRKNRYMLIWAAIKESSGIQIFVFESKFRAKKMVPCYIFVEGTTIYIRFHVWRIRMLMNPTF